MNNRLILTDCDMCGRRGVMSEVMSDWCVECYNDAKYDLYEWDDCGVEEKGNE